MIRRQTRERREYLYKKSLQTVEKEKFVKKQTIRDAIKNDKPIPTELRDDEKALRAEMELEIGEDEPSTNMDDEYLYAGVKDPKVVLTTARDPSSRLTQFAKEVKLMFPNAQKINRGNYVLKDLADVCRSNDVTDLIILHEHRGEPDGMIISHFPYGPTAFFSLQGVVLRHDIPEHGPMSEQFPHLIFDQFSSTLGQRVQNILKYLFPVPRLDSKRVMTFANQRDTISFRHNVFQKTSHKDVHLLEVGPRFEMKLYQIKLGTLDITEADVEWVSKPYMNTARKRNHLD
eukprot:Lithocolla_globosa_v1_NODE_1653_length_2417_cov_24.680779.p1 type:complete len:288 gc:universal NODE_1653_length_2417_cov_24.680779:961-1824(+)